MSTHVVPAGERQHHVPTMDCRCNPVEQSAIDGDRIVWVIRHHEIAVPDLAERSERGGG